MRGLTLVFDLDGTLVDTAPDLVAATNHTLGLKGLAPVEGALIRPMISHGARAMIVAGLAHHGAALRGSEIDELLAQFLAHYGDNIAAASRPYAGIAAILARYRDAGSRIAVCTNKTELLSRRLLRALALEGAIDAIAGRDTFAACKPDPEHLLGAIAMAGGRANRAIMVGDSATDIDTAHGAGIPVIGVSFGYSDPPMATLAPTIMIDSYDAFDEAVSAILAGYAGG